MRSTALFSPRRLFAVSLLSLDLLISVCAVPLPFDVEGMVMMRTLHRRTDITIGGKVAVLGERLSPDSHAKSEVYRLAEWDGKSNPGYIVKVYKTASLNAKEINALKLLNEWIADDASTKALVMKEAKGILFSKLLADTPGAKRAALMQEWQPKIAEAAANVAKKYNIYHQDLNKDNILISGSTVTLIDWEHYVERGKPGFTDDASKIEKELRVVWSTPAGSPSPPKSGSPKTGSPKPGSPETSPPKTSPPKTSSPETSPPKTGSPKPGSPKTSSPKTSSPKTSSPKTSSHK